MPVEKRRAFCLPVFYRIQCSVELRKRARGPTKLPSEPAGTVHTGPCYPYYYSTQPHITDSYLIATVYGYVSDS